MIYLYILLGLWAYFLIGIGLAYLIEQIGIDMKIFPVFLLWPITFVPFLIIAFYVRYQQDNKWKLL